MGKIDMIQISAAKSPISRTTWVTGTSSVIVVYFFLIIIIIIFHIGVVKHIIPAVASTNATIAGKSIPVLKYGNL